ncbi:hypothetical protein EII34_10710 [Arachnia propionica]|uniref:Uncharacterized protein n=1 Tax=Arachnia propionica TaxID=1750 RepID=A0A3P1T643_9ACTN|nr:hypothetical protein [Arachnia propionica]RRD04296.1 hypothetical protein EII34_10710 [Arachnia propionica]
MTTARPLLPRRRFLTTLALAGTALTGLSGCSWLGWGSSDPAGRLPWGFEKKSAWPGAKADVVMTGIRNQYLTAAMVIPELRHIFRDGWTPVVVDVTGPTTRAVSLTEDGSWTTVKVTPQSPDGHGDSPGTARTVLFPGPAVMDDTHAYVTMGVVPLERPDQDITEVLEKGSALVLLKIHLADGAVVGSVTLGERCRTGEKLHEELQLSFNEDRTALLVAHDNRLTDGADWLGLRVSAGTLGVEFDAHSLLRHQRDPIVTPLGQAIAVHTGANQARLVVFLTNGETLQKPDRRVGRVMGGWSYETTGTRGGETHVMRNVLTGQEKSLPAHLGGTSLPYPSWPSVFIDPLVSVRDLSGMPLTIHQPDSDTPTRTVTLKSYGDLLSAGFHQGALYLWHRETDAQQKTKNLLVIQPLGSDQELPLEWSADAPLNDVHVTAWGVLDADTIKGPRFYRATQWLPGAATPSPTSSPS